MQGFRAAVFLDRDGTVIEEKHYLSDPDAVVLIPGAAEAIARLNTSRVAVVLVTNQSGVARGYFDEARVHAVHERLSTLIGRAGGRFDAIYYCPHLAAAPLDAYRLDCDCRKPRPGMVQAARDDLGLHGLPSFVIGDKALDIELARAVHAAGILVRTGYGRAIEGGLYGTPAQPDVVLEDLPAAVTWIEARLSGG